jgi:glutathione S-transferase
MPDRLDEWHRNGHRTLAAMEAHLEGRDWFVCEAMTLADIALYGYTHVAHEAGLPMGDFPAVQAWLGRVARRPGHMNDLAPYPPNARPGAGRSIYD